MMSPATVMGPPSLLPPSRPGDPLATVGVPSGPAGRGRPVRSVPPRDGPERPLAWPGKPSRGALGPRPAAHPDTRDRRTTTRTSPSARAVTDVQQACWVRAGGARRRDGRARPAGRRRVGRAEPGPGRAGRGGRRPDRPARPRGGAGLGVPPAAGGGRRARAGHPLRRPAPAVRPPAGLDQLCAPLLEWLGDLPGPQRDALGTALGLATGRDPDPFLVGGAVLGLLTEVAEGGPLVGLVDDVQWLDRPSAQVLGFVARRRPAAPVALVLALRTPGDTGDLAGLPALLVDALGATDARALLAAVVPGRLDER